MDDAVNVMQKAHVDGLACVISCSQEDAETYCEGSPLAPRAAGEGVDCTRD